MMMANSSRTLATSKSGREIKVRRTSALPPANALTFLNAQESPFLKLPPELRNRVYELVFGGHFIHVEGDERTDSCKTARPYGEDAWLDFVGGDTTLGAWGRTHCLHYYICKAAISEDAAYQRSRDANLNEQLPSLKADGTRDSEVDLSNCWRAGDPFHIDSCAERHRGCYPVQKPQKPAWMIAPRDRAYQLRTNVSLDKILNLSVLQTSQQVYQEAKNLPLSLNTFGVRDPVALLFLLFRLGPSRSNAIKTLWIYLRLGRSPTHFADIKRWNDRLFTPSLLPNIQGLRVLHISLSLVHAGMGDEGPHRSELHDPHLNGWVLGLNSFRALPLERVTVIVADDPDSNYGVVGFNDRVNKYVWNWSNDFWFVLRRDNCFMAFEKRQWSERLRKHLMKETTEI